MRKYGFTQVLSNAATQKKQLSILDAARDLFLERGYDAVSMDDIRERVGGSKTTLYSYYGDKEGLFTAMIRRLCDEKLGQVLALNVTEMEPGEGLRAIGRVFLTTVFQPEGQSLFRAMVTEALRFPKLIDVFYAAGPQSMINALKRHMEHWQHRRLLEGGDPEMLAEQFLGIVLARFHTRTVLGLELKLTEDQIRDWVDGGVELFLSGAMAGRESEKLLS